MIAFVAAFVLFQVDDRPYILNATQAKYFAAAFYERIGNLDMKQHFDQIEVLKFHPDFWWAYIREKPGELPLELSGLVLDAQFAMPVAFGASSPKQGLEMAALWRKRLKPPVCPRPCCKKKP